MKEQKKTALDGTVITIYIPENQYDIDWLDAMRKDGQAIDDRHGFADVDDEQGQTQEEEADADE